MTEREALLRSGHVEELRKYDRDVKLYLYWEPYVGDDGKYGQGFVVDQGDNYTRQRFDNFDDAVKYVEKLDRELDIKAALEALGIQGGLQ